MPPSLPTQTGNARWLLFAAAAGLVAAGALAGGLLSRHFTAQAQPAGAPEAAPPALRAEAAPSTAKPLQSPKPVCASCGIVEAVQAQTLKGEASGVGAVAGGVIGGLIGNQMGGGNGKKAMTVVGAVGGGMAGNEIEKQHKARTVYRTQVRMDDGSLRSFTRSEALAVGQKVRVDGQKLLPA